MRCINYAQFKPTLPYVPCNRCWACRVTRREQWLTKMELEYSLTGIGSFITLTYAPEHLPKKDQFPGKGSLDPEDTKRFFKLFRQNYKRKHNRNANFTHYTCGEYGDTSGRAHYHVLLFGYDPIEIKKLVTQSWTKGNALVLNINKFDPDPKKNRGMFTNRARYMVKHTQKLPEDLEKLHEDQLAPFSRMSRRPALGHLKLPLFAQKFNKNNLFPAAGLSLYFKYLLENDPRFQYIQPSFWNGGFKRDDKNNIVFDVFDREESTTKNLKSAYYRLDRASLYKLAKLADPDTVALLELIHETEPVPLEYVSVIEDNISESVDRLDEYVTSGDLSAAKNLAAKSERTFRAKKLRTINV